MYGELKIVMPFANARLKNKTNVPSRGIRTPAQELSTPRDKPSNRGQTINKKEAEADSSNSAIALDHRSIDGTRDNVALCKQGALAAYLPTSRDRRPQSVSGKIA